MNNKAMAERAGKISGRARGLTSGQAGKDWASGVKQMGTSWSGRVKKENVMGTINRRGKGNKQIKCQNTSLIGLEGENLAGDVLRDIPLIGHGDKDKAPVGTTNTVGNKATIGEVMGRVVDALKQSQHKQMDWGRTARSRQYTWERVYHQYPRSWLKGSKKETL